MAVSLSAPPPPHDVVAANIRRLMARHGLTYDDLVAATELDERTVRGIMRGANKPHARTLHKLATGLGVGVDELFQSEAATPERDFDRATNPVVDDVVAAHPEVFRDWTAADFDELFSRFGTGGQLSPSGTLAAARQMNANRVVLHRAAIILESSQAQLLEEFVDFLYQRVAR